MANWLIIQILLQWITRIALILCFSLVSFNSFSWGFYAHRMINGKAIFFLPEELFLFYKNNHDYLTEHSVDPDKRRYAVKGEGPRHYIDLDKWIDNDSTPIDSLDKELPLYWNKAVEKYGEDSLNEFGVLPWHLNLMVFRLTEVFKQKDVEVILKLSAEIGHYASDGHVPLHTTENYNGQLTGQKGIHALWESRVPERHAESYTFLGEKAKFFENTQLEIWSVVLESHRSVDFVLQSEMEVRQIFEEDIQFKLESQGRSIKRSYSTEYIDAYAELNNQLVQQRMISSSWFIASLWYTAWINAGQPDMNSLTSKVFEDESVELNEPELDHER